VGVLAPFIAVIQRGEASDRSGCLQRQYFDLGKTKVSLAADTRMKRKSGLMARLMPQHSRTTSVPDFMFAHEQSYQRRRSRSPHHGQCRALVRSARAARTVCQHVGVGGPQGQVNPLPTAEYARLCAIG